VNLNKPYAILAVGLIIFFCCLVTLSSFVIDFSGGGAGPGRGGDVLSVKGYSFFFTTNNPNVDISLGFTPARGVVLYCTYSITDSSQNVVDGSTMLHMPFSSDYVIKKTLTNLANDNYTFTITTHYANGTVRTPINETFTVDTTFEYPILTVISPQNQTYNDPVAISYNINSKVLMSYYKLDSQEWTFFDGNTTLIGLYPGAHALAISVVTEANRHIAQANEVKTIYFTVDG
jgi:hypothetical protein